MDLNLWLKFALLQPNTFTIHYPFANQPKKYQFGQWFCKFRFIITLPIHNFLSCSCNFITGLTLFIKFVPYLSAHRPLNFSDSFHDRIGRFLILTGILVLQDLFVCEVSLARKDAKTDWSSNSEIQRLLVNSFSIFIILYQNLLLIIKPYLLIIIKPFLFDAAASGQTWQQPTIILFAPGRRKETPLSACSHSLNLVIQRV